MPKAADSSWTKQQIWIREYPIEFVSNLNGTLFCKLCLCIVKTERGGFVKSYRSWAKHQKSLNGITSSSLQPFLHFPQTPDFTDQVCRAFLAANIPLYKLRNPFVRDYFSSAHLSLPSESECLRRAPSLAIADCNKVKLLLAGKKTFAVVDEGRMYGVKFLVTLLGLLTDPATTFLYRCVWTGYFSCW